MRIQAAPDSFDPKTWPQHYAAVRQRLNSGIAARPLDHALTTSDTVKAEQIGDAENQPAVVPIERAPPIKKSKRRNAGASRLSRILQATADRFSTSESDLIGEFRRTRFAYPRQIIFYLLKTMTGMSLPAIGRHMQRNHSTVLYGITKIGKLIEIDEKVRADVEFIRQKVLSEELV